MGFSRQEYWNGLLFRSPGESSQPRDQTRVSCIAGGFFTFWATREALIRLLVCLILHEVKMIYVILPETDFVIKQTLDLLVNGATNRLMCAHTHAHTNTYTIALYWRAWDHTGIFHWNNIAEELLCFQKYQNGTVLCLVPQSMSDS